MRKLSAILAKGRLLKFPDGSSPSRTDAIKSLLSILWENSDLKSGGLSQEQILSTVLEREEELPTGAGLGFAFPHARIEGLKCEGQVAFGICSEGVGFGAADGIGAKFIMLSVIPASTPNFILRTRSALIGMLSSPELRAKMLAAQNADEIWALIDGNGTKTEKDVLAKDIMRKPVVTGNDGMTLRDAVLMMSKAKTDVLPVVDAEGRFVGDVTIKELLAHGMPEFFYSLKTVSFVRHMDPFEGYFAIDRTLKLKDMKSLKDTSVLPPDATLMEIVFELTVKGRKMAHVVEDGKLLGVIDRSFLIDKILLTA